MRLALKVACVLAAVPFYALPGKATEPESCQKIRMAEPGWNDLALTTGVAMVLMKALGYEAESSNVSIEAIYQSLKNNDLDVYLGYWDPTMVKNYQPYKDDGSVETVRINLEGAKYTFAVPTYVWDAGVKDFKDLSKFADKFEKKLYGIDPGTNQPMLDAVADPEMNLAGWEVVESSEVGMLTEVERHLRNKDYIVFLGWEPHPMNTLYDMKYLTGGDKYFGPNFGSSTVSTQVRAGYLTECPNTAKLLKNLVFDLNFENKGIGYLMNDSMKQEDAARKTIKEHPEKLEKWLDGVTTIDGKPGLEAVKAALELPQSG